ncbi:MAG: hypothetical protein JWO26_1981 [Rhodospirillales bacterium]|jgi:hypothetical protein|nr:hypothetical protein [Rhodospirillales bacterium]
MVDPTLADLRNLCISLDDEAQVLLAAIAAKESGIEHRDHVDAPGRDVLAPALGVWQSERGGGVAGVLRHPASRLAAVAICRAEGVAPEPDAIWYALKLNGRLAADLRGCCCGPI